MVEFRQVLCPIDLSESSAVSLGYAITIARWYEARLTVLHVVPTFDAVQVSSGGLGAPVQLSRPVPPEEVTAALRTALDAAGAGSIEATVAAEAGDPAATIVDLAVTGAADLLVMGTHGRSGFDRMLLGSVAERVLRKAPCPVLTVPPHAPARAPKNIAFKRILCPMDFSPSALQALGFALDLAQQSNGIVTVMHVIEWLAEHEPRANAQFNAADYRKHLADEAHERMRPLVAEAAGPRCEFEHVVVMGRPYREIARIADEKEVDLIVMGAQGRGAMGLALFGSTAQQVVRTVACPVLTVRG